MSCADGRHRSPRAIEDEERSQGSVHGFLVYWRYVSVAQVYVKDSCLHQVFVQ
jgi:hypothetical protein